MSPLAQVFDFKGRVVKPPRFLLVLCQETGLRETAWHHSGPWYRCEGCGRMFKSGGW
jgi:ribosomal protein S27E